jgi:hypothetical protein
LLIFVMPAALATGCGGSTVVPSVPATATTTSTIAVDYEPFSVRLVLASAAPPCNSADAAVVPQRHSERVIGCFTVGDATVTGRDIESAKVSSANAFSVNITLTAEGAKRLDDLFAQHLAEQVAMVWHSQVIAVLTIDAPSVDGEISIGGIGSADAQRLVTELGRDPSDTPDVDTSDPDVPDDSLYQLCEQHRPPEVGDAPVVLAMSQTAGEVTSAAQQLLGHALPPWDALPADHVVAECGYDTLGVIDGDTSTTVCANGEVAEVSTPRAYLVDEDGRWTDDAVSSLPSVQIDTCH